DPARGASDDDGLAGERVDKRFHDYLSGNSVKAESDLFGIACSDSALIITNNPAPPCGTPDRIPRADGVSRSDRWAESALISSPTRSGGRTNITDDSRPI